MISLGQKSALHVLSRQDRWLKVPRPRLKPVIASNCFMLFCHVVVAAVDSVGDKGLDCSSAENASVILITTTKTLILNKSISCFVNRYISSNDKAAMNWQHNVWLCTM